MAPDTLESQQPARDDVTGEMVGKVYKESRVPPAAADRTGLKAVQQALDLMRATPEPPPELMTRALIELGDWFQSTSRPAMSMPYYAEAAAILDEQSAADPLMGHPLRAPRMVFYRPPVSASRGLNTLSGQYIIRKTVFSFLVTEDGVPRDITVVSTDMNEDQVGLSRRAVAKAIYSPRFADGKAVSTAGVTFTGEWYEEFLGEEPPPEPAEATPAPTRAAARREPVVNSRSLTAAAPPGADCPAGPLRPAVPPAPPRARAGSFCPTGHRLGRCDLSSVVGGICAGVNGSGGGLSVSGGCGGDAGSGLPAPRSSSRTDSWSVNSTATLAPASRMARWVATASGSLLASVRAFSRP